MKNANDLPLDLPAPTDADATNAPALVKSSEPSIGEMLQVFIEKGITSENVTAFERLVALKERMDERHAERDFAHAFAALQSDLGPMRATKIVPDRQGNQRYTYLPYETIMEQVRPLLDKHGFSVSFSTEFKEGRIVQTCTLQHIKGHHRDYQAYVRVGQGPFGATETQADGAAMTYAKRYALCNALNIIVEHDTDARKEGAPISSEQAQYLRELVKETKSDEGKFLKFAGASTYEEIGSERYDALARELHRKQQNPQ